MVTVPGWIQPVGVVPGHIDSARPGPARGLSVSLGSVAGIDDTTVIDVVSHDPTSDEYVLHMVEGRPWGVDPLQGAWLQEKINAYAGFVLDGTLVANYPEIEGRALCFQLDCAEPPTGEFEAITRVATEQLARLGIGFRVNARGA